MGSGTTDAVENGGETYEVRFSFFFFLFLRIFIWARYMKTNRKNTIFIPWRSTSVVRLILVLYLDHIYTLLIKFWISVSQFSQSILSLFPHFAKTSNPNYFRCHIIPIWSYKEMETDKCDSYSNNRNHMKCISDFYAEKRDFLLNVLRLFLRFWEVCKKTPCLSKCYFLVPKGISNCFNLYKI